MKTKIKIKNEFQNPDLIFGNEIQKRKLKLKNEIWKWKSEWKFEMEENNMAELNLYRLYYNQRITEVVSSSFEMAFTTEKSWYSKGAILFIENVNTSEIRKFIV